jgi:hypothetical protein
MIIMEFFWALSISSFACLLLPSLEARELVGWTQKDIYTTFQTYRQTDRWWDCWKDGKRLGSLFLGVASPRVSFLPYLPCLILSGILVLSVY